MPLIEALCSKESLVMRICLGVLILLFLFGCASTDKTNIKSEPSIFETAIENRVHIKPLIYIEPLYPVEEAKNNIEGDCKLSFDLENQGKGAVPANLTLIECTNNNFYKQCKNSVKKWLFLPIERFQGKELHTGLVTTCKFRLNAA